MKNVKVLITIAGLLVAGCTTLSAKDCSSTDWYQLGVRDGQTNSNLITSYTEQCASPGAQPDAARYAQGRARGLWIRVHDHLLYTP
jgi:hypothetical protein